MGPKGKEKLLKEGEKFLKECQDSTCNTSVKKKTGKTAIITKA